MNSDDIIMDQLNEIVLLLRSIKELIEKQQPQPVYVPYYQTHPVYPYYPCGESRPDPACPPGWTTGTSAGGNNE